MSKHTPGPWEATILVGSENTEQRVHAGARRIACFCRFTGLLEEDQANFRLIAVAPEMYDFIQTVRLVTAAALNPIDPDNAVHLWREASRILETIDRA